MPGGPGGGRAGALACLLSATLVVGCASGSSLTRTVGGWFGAEESPPRAYYIGVARAKLYRAADANSEVLGELALHEGVLRYRVDGSFSYVKSERSGRAGWLETANLTDRTPQASPPSRAASPASAAPVAAPEADEPATTPEGETVEPEAPAPPEKSVFDPYF